MRDRFWRPNWSTALEPILNRLPAVAEAGQGFDVDWDSVLRLAVLRVLSLAVLRRRARAIEAAEIAGQPPHMAGDPQIASSSRSTGNAP
jgi:hypothetical protein